MPSSRSFRTSRILTNSATRKFKTLTYRSPRRIPIAAFYTFRQNFCTLRGRPRPQRATVEDHRFHATGGHLTLAQAVSRSRLPIVNLRGTMADLPFHFIGADNEAIPRLARTIHQEIDRVRIERAKTLLADTNLPMQGNQIGKVSFPATAARVIAWTRNRHKRPSDRARRLGRNHHIVTRGDVSRLLLDVKPLLVPDSRWVRQAKPTDRLS
jgi:hypothetical protein